tara:strand:- start:3984 stop:5123 length:1140 start_codon:yes stop_codon:yes gene_type:complete
MGEVKQVTSYNDMFDFTPEQMAQQLRSSKPDNVIDGVYIEQTKFGEKRFNPDGSVEIVKGGEVLRRIEPQDADMAYKNKIMKNEGEKPEVKAAQEKRRAEFDAERIKQQAQEAESYKMQHTAPTREENPSGDDLTDTFGSDIYTGNALQYFGTGSSYDQKAINIIQGMKGKPERPVTIYRAVPKDIKDINASDWVTTTREYAKDHMEGEKDWHILSKKVKAKDIATDGNSIHEFGYDPADKFDEIKTLPYKEKAKLASKWKTGQPIKLNYARNTVSSKNYPAGMDFGQKIEPAGRYMNVDFDDKGFNKSIPDWEFGEIEFENPIVLEHKSTNSTGWKKDLSEMFGGSTGKRLTNKLKKAGHDGIITKDADGFNETISIK